MDGIGKQRHGSNGGRHGELNAKIGKIKQRHEECGPAESGVVGGNDPIFLRDPVPHSVNVPRTLDPPNGWTADASTWKMVVDLANRLGYFDYEADSTSDAVDKR